MEKMGRVDGTTLIPEKRLARYLSASGGQRRRALALYRGNLQLSQAMFTLISILEIALRNSIDKHLKENGADQDWLWAAVQTGGCFDQPSCIKSKQLILSAYQELSKTRTYSHDKLIAELTFGFWRFLFAPAQFKATGKNLLGIFIHKPRGQQYNQKWIFDQLAEINKLRNRIAHHEPICFKGACVDLSMARKSYQTIMNLFYYMSIDESDIRFFIQKDIEVVLFEMESLTRPTSLYLNSIRMLRSH